MFRRLPIYLLIDTSEHMRGDAIASVRQGIRALLSDLQGDPQALETVYLSSILFSSSGHQASPLSDLLEFHAPSSLTPSGTACLGAALKTLSDAMDRELVQTSETTKGDWAPIVLLFTAGNFDDQWRSVGEAFRKQHRGTFVAFLAGNASRRDSWEGLVDVVIHLSELQPGAMGALLQWTSASVSVGSAPVVSLPAKPSSPATSTSGASSGDTQALVEFLIQQGADVNSIDDDGQTPMHVAVRGNDLDTVRLLLCESPDLSVADHDGNTPLHLAIMHRHLEAARLLVENGADPNAKNARGMTSLQLAIAQGSDSLRLPDAPAEIKIVP